MVGMRGQLLEQLERARIVQLSDSFLALSRNARTCGYRPRQRRAGCRPDRTARAAGRQRQSEICHAAPKFVVER